VPHATDNYNFEWIVFSALGRRFGNETGILLLDAEGNVLSALGESPDGNWHATTRRLEAEGRPHIFYDPFDAPEYCWVAWFRVGLEAMERLTGHDFVEADLAPRTPPLPHRPTPDPPGSFPETWGVMF
jgi:hypothetical protein